MNTRVAIPGETTVTLKYDRLNANLFLLISPAQGQKHKNQFPSLVSFSVEPFLDQILAAMALIFHGTLPIFPAQGPCTPVRPTWIPWTPCGGTKTSTPILAALVPCLLRRARRMKLSSRAGSKDVLLEVLLKA